jgi:ABC-type transport system involved in multi-copper enzyme maturation permease subunit
MAVYERTYRRYDGPLTSSRSRFTVLSRYARSDLSHSRLFLLAFLGCFIAPIVALIAIYLHHNASALLRLQVDLADLVPIDAGFFLGFLSIQGVAAYIMALLVGPALVSADLSNNALPLYLSRPLTRFEYVLGKALVLIVLLSLVTWVPSLLLFAFQALLASGGWMADNLRVGAALFVASWMWIVVLTLLSLAVSAAVRRRHVARIVLLALLFVPAALGSAINELLNTQWGALLDLRELIRVAWGWLFLTGADGPMAEVLRQGESIPAWAAWLALAVLCLFCSVLLARKVRAYEVVRS